jgi:vitamin B12 transporter
LCCSKFSKEAITFLENNSILLLFGCNVNQTRTKLTQFKAAERVSFLNKRNFTMKCFSYMSSIILILSSLLSAQEKVYNLDEIVVSAGRTPVSIANLSRSVSILTFDEIKNIPVNNLIDLLKFVGGVDLRARGPEGIQADVAIRGGSFEETLIMIDGVVISDPQTGHNSLSLPISLDNVERIEVLKGEAGRVFGANAFSGAINIITRKKRDNSLSLSSIGGQNGLYELGISGSLSTGIVGNSISVARKKSDGYKENTDFESTNFSLSQNYSFSNATLNLLFGYVDKQFGANSFYSDLFPLQNERTLTKFGNASMDIKLGEIVLSSKIFLRTNFDDYHLDKNRPDWNHNTHRTNSFGAEFQSSFSSALGTTSFGLDFSKDEINSSNLGEHDRNKGGFFAEQSFQPINNFSVSGGLFAYNYSSIGWKLLPGVDANYKPTDNLKIFASVGQSFRIPTFTELYYVSPSNLGNPYLHFEQTLNYELGISYNKEIWRINTNVFIKQGKDLIDWVRPTKTSPWQVQNVTELTTIGFETELTVNMQKLFYALRINNIALSYTYLSSDRSASGFESKYLLDHLRHQLIINISNDFPFGITQSWTARFERRINLDSNFIIDSQLSKTMVMFSIFIRATNLFNEPYFDIVGVPLPGRWLSAGVRFSMTGI